MNYQQQIAENYPTLVPHATTKYKYTGFITNDVQSSYQYAYYLQLYHDLYSTIEHTHNTIEIIHIDHIHLSVDQSLHKLLHNTKHNYIHILHKRIKQYHTNCIYQYIYIVLTELNELIEQVYELQSNTVDTTYNTHNIEFNIELIKQLQHIDINTINSIDTTLHKFIVHLHTHNTVHTLQIVLPYNWPIKQALIYSNLSEQPPHNSTYTLSQQIYAYKHLIESLQLYFDQLNDFDEHTWILEPDINDTTQKYQCNYRRIHYNNNTSIHITLDIHHSTAIPKLLFLGNNSAVQPYIDMWSNTAAVQQQWNHKHTVRENIEHCLKIQFPTQSIEQSADSDELSCVICYTYTLDINNTTEIPSIQCTNTQCQRYYHYTCIVEWLQSNIGVTKSFNTLFGTCVNCEQSIQVKLRD